MEAENAGPAYLVAELVVRDMRKLSRYAAQVQPLMRAYGGRVLAISHRGCRPVEGDWHPDLLVVHRWHDTARFDEFWNSAAYAPLKELRQDACASRIVLVDALDPPEPGNEPGPR